MIKPGYIRVSQILGQWDRFGGINEEVLKKKCALGTEVHDAIKAHHQDVALPVAGGEGYFESFDNWFTASGVTIHTFAERMYCDKLKLTGEIDAIVRFSGSDELVIVDWKTSSASDDLYWKLQGQFYHYLCTVNEIKVGPRFLFIKLDKQGKLPKVREYQVSSSLMNICISAYTCYKYLNKLDVNCPNQ
jgi:hypothetical protein